MTKVQVYDSLKGAKEQRKKVQEEKEKSNKVQEEATKNIEEMIEKKKK